MAGDGGSEDSHGRTLWALGNMQSGAAVGRPAWADALFAKAMPAAEAFQSPRAWAFTLLGLDSWCEATEGDLRARRLRAITGGTPDGMPALGGAPGLDMVRRCSRL